MRTSMFNRIRFAAACCLLFSTTVGAQSGVDFRDAVRTTAPATVAVKLDVGEAQRANLNLYRRQMLDLTGIPGRIPFQSALNISKPTCAGFAVAPDLVISCDVPNSSDVDLFTHDGHELSGRVVARDHVTGLVAIRIKDASLSVLAVAADAPQAGLPVLISWLRDGRTVTSEAGMIATDPNSDEPDIGYTQQLDAEFTPQKLGAPIVDGDGTVVGVLVGKAGIAVCLPVNQLARLIEAASAEIPSDLFRGRLGIQLNEQQEGADGVLIAGVTVGMPAQEAELSVGDKVTKVGDHDCKVPMDVMAAVAMSRAGDEVTLNIKRGDQTLERTIKLASAGPEPHRTRYLPIGPGPGTLQQLFQLQDGKLVPMAQNPAQSGFPIAQPRTLMLGNLKAERSELEQSLKKLEAENARLKEIVEAIKKQLKSEASGDE